MELVVKRDKGLLIFLGLNVADCIVTAIVLTMGGVENSWYKFMFGVMPMVVTLSLKMLIVVLIAFVVSKYRRTLFRPLNVGMALIVAANLLPLIAYQIGRAG